MTLILGLSKPDGVYLSVDYRVTNEDTGEILDDYAVKFLTVQYWPEGAGPKVLFAYTGLAQLWGGMPVGRWLRETLRGETETIDQSMELLMTKLNQSIAPFGKGLCILGAVVAGGSRYLVQITNTTDWKTIEPKFAFIQPLALDGYGSSFFAGSGQAGLIAGGYRELLKSQAGVRPRRAWEHMNLLATINRRVAEADPGGPVSPYCHVTYMGDEDDWTPRCQAFYERGEEPVPFSLPMIVYGIDVTNVMDQMMGAVERDEHPTLDPDQIRRNLKRRP